MELPDSQTSPEALSAFGLRAIGLLCHGEFEGLASWVPYALSHGRDPASAIAADLALALGENNRLLDSRGASCAVKYFAPNDTQLFALVECSIPSKRGFAVLVELVVLGSERKFLALGNL